MEDDRRTIDQKPPASLMIAGGALTLISAFLTWFEIQTGGGSADRSYSGVDLMSTLGGGLIVFGVVLLVIGAYHSLTRPRGRGLAIISIVVAAFVALTALIAIGRPVVSLGSFGGEQVADDFLIAEDDDVIDVLQSAEDEGVINLQPGSGALVALGGGVLALLGGGIALARRRRGENPSTTDGPALG